MGYLEYEKNVTGYFNSLPKESFEDVSCVFNEKHSSVEVFRKNSMVVKKCECGFIFNARQANEDALEKFYEKSEAMTAWSQLKQTDEQHTKQFLKYQKAIDWIGNSSIKSLLDVACGTGKFIQLLNKACPWVRTLGVDTNHSSVEIARKQKLNVIHCDFKNILAEMKETKTTTEFDLVSLWGILEHVKNPREFLMDVSWFLSPRSYVIVCVPNSDSLAMKVLREKCFTFCPQHLWYFNLGSLTKLFEECGFKRVDSWTIEPEIDPVNKSLNYLDPYGNYDGKFVGPPGKTIKRLADQQGYKIVGVYRLV